MIIIIIAKQVPCLKCTTQYLVQRHVNGHDTGIIPQLHSIELFPVISEGQLSLHTDGIKLIWTDLICHLKWQPNSISIYHILETLSLLFLSLNMLGYF